MLVRILLRNALTHFYYVEEKEYTEDRNLARTFRTSAEALRFVQEERLENMEIVFTFGPPEYDLTIRAELMHRKPKNPPPPEQPFV